MLFLKIVIVYVNYIIQLVQYMYKDYAIIFFWKMVFFITYSFVTYFYYKFDTFVGNIFSKNVIYNF